MLLFLPLILTSKLIVEWSACRAHLPLIFFGYLPVVFSSFPFSLFSVFEHKKAHIITMLCKQLANFNSNWICLLHFVFNQRPNVERHQLLFKSIIILFILISFNFFSRLFHYFLLNSLLIIHFYWLIFIVLSLSHIHSFKLSFKFKSN